MLKISLLALFIADFNFVRAQDRVPVCKELHTGIYYTYNSKTGDAFVSILEERQLKEIIVNLDDTVISRINWIDDCTFIQQYVSGGSKLDKKILDFNKEHIFYTSIDKIAEEYFTTTVRQDKPKGRVLLRDTSWFNERINVAKIRDVEKISSSLMNRNVILTDTSQYALLYIYRPGKIFLSLSSYPLFMNGELLCMMQNKSGFIFKVKKEGRYSLRTNILKDESKMDVDVRFGQKYFIKPVIYWGVKKHLYNFKLGFEVPENLEIGMREFGEVKLK